jgi:LuxR family maltose regulon positive regulatory protein
MALIALGWRALWLARFDEATGLLAQAEADAQWIGEYIIARSFGLALRAVLAMHPTLPEATERRLLPARGPQGTACRLEGRRDEAIAHWQAALAQEEACDLIGQANELRLRLAAARLGDGAPDEAAAWIAPCLQQAEDGPRGAVFAREALAELARADWRGRLAPDEHATQTAWAAALAAPAADAPAQESAGAERLTARELEVLARIAAGDSNKLIARAFDLSLHTVKRHVANILGKVGAESRGQAAAWYLAKQR